MTLNPSPTTRALFAQLQDCMSWGEALLLRSVRYSPALDLSSRLDDPHEVEMAISLDLGIFCLRLDWAIRGETEGMAVQPGVPLPADWGSVEVTDSPPWSELRNQVLTELRPVWHSADHDADECVVAMSFGFTDRNVTIAIGEIVGVAPTYHPETLLVFFDGLSANDYLLDLAAQWGSNLLPPR